MTNAVHLWQSIHTGLFINALGYDLSGELKRCSKNHDNLPGLQICKPRKAHTPAL